MARGRVTNPTGKGGAKKGEPSRNPRGRPKKDFNAQALAAKYTRDGEDLMKFWREQLDLETVLDPVTGRIIAGPSWTEKNAAATKIAERLWGKAPEHLKAEITGKDGGPQQHEHEHKVFLELPD